jgi:MFS transporter, DHA2 family, multidrug resistance protein
LSAVGDSFELGGALGIAFLGVIVTVAYRDRITDALPAGIPPNLAEAAKEAQGARSRLPTPFQPRSWRCCWTQPGAQFTYGLQLAFAVSAVMALGLAVLTRACFGV